jgi:cathepsin B
MKAYALLALCIYAYTSFIQDSINLANSIPGLWKPIQSETDSVFYGMSESEIKALFIHETIPQFKAIHYLRDDASFDARKKWPLFPQKPFNQGNCGSCWAAATVSTMNWRFFTQYNMIKNLSVQQIISCDSSDMGCNGGTPSNAMKYIASNGLVSELNYPYTASDSSCKISNTDRSYIQANTIVDESTPKSVADIKREISTGGPIVMVLIVYQDFMSYSSGIYVRKSSNMLGGHAVVGVGYGSENGIDYWIGQNSWGSNWGESGYFRIKLGECEIENHCSWSKVKI